MGTRVEARRPVRKGGQGITEGGVAGLWNTKIDVRQNDKILQIFLMKSPKAFRQNKE